MRKSLLVPTFALTVLAALPATAQLTPPGGGEGPLGDCEATDSCGNPNPPPQPYLPGTSNIGGGYRLYFGGDYHDGYITGDQNSFQSTYIGAGPYRPVGGPTLAVGSSASNASFTPTFTPDATAATSVSSDGMKSAQGELDIYYLVELHAANAAAYDALTPFLNASGAIGHIGGSYTLSQSGQAYSVASAQTGVGIYLDGSLQKSMGSICDRSGYYSSTGANCVTTNYTLDLNFVAGSTFVDGNPLSIYGSIELNTDAHAGPTGISGYAGMASAFIDPTITLNPLFNTPLYMLNTGNQVTPYAGGGGAGAVPEPAAWALMVVGFGVVGGLARRQRPRAVAA